MHQNEDSNVVLVVQCSFCGQNYERTALKRHEEDCFQKSTRRTLNSKQEEWTHSSNQNRDQLLVTRSYPSNFNNSIPCQYCNDNELFDPVQLNDHIKTYHERNDQPLFQRHIKQQCIVTTVPCEYCEMQCQFDDVNIHQVTTFFLLI
ncbi:unnamed protein product [Rotaria sordida]|uniref:Uncharacterized protein n=1 Tax=Rotaria sordida TaxID=392033 RepID=A0A813QDX7_9BILA|nr:unnamed protein product [Rotaria sordida]